MRGRAVITADFHIHPYRLCSRDGGHDRLMDGLSVLRQSLDLARELDAVWVMAGDFKQPKTFWPQSALTGAHAILREYEDVGKVMVAGNHDAEGEGGSGLAPFKDVADVVETVVVFNLGLVGPAVVFAPWNADPADVRMLVESNGGCPLIAHRFLQGCMLGPEDTRLARGTPVSEYGDFSVAFFGDVHKGQWRTPADPPRPPEWLAYVEGQKIREAGPWRGEVYYAGSPYQQNWGERNDPLKGALVVDFGTGEVGMRVFGAPRYRHFEVDEGSLVNLIGRMEDYRGDFVRVVYTGKPTTRLDQLRELGDECRSFQLIAKRPEKSERRADVHAGLETGELLRRYVDARPPAGLDKDRVLEAGVRLTGGDQ